MKFAIAQEISRHVRDKLCKFYNTNKAEQSTTCTITSNEEKTEAAAEQAEVEVKSAETSTSKQTFALITSDSIKYPSTDDDKVHVTTATNEDEEESPSQGIEMDNFDLLSSAFQISNVTNNETDEDDDNEFGMIIGEIDNKVDGEIVKILFTCKICDFR